MKKRINLYLDEDLIKEAKKLAIDRKSTVSMFAQIGLKEIIKRNANIPKMTDEKIIEKMDKMFKEYQQWKKNKKV